MHAGWNSTIFRAIGSAIEIGRELGPGLLEAACEQLQDGIQCFVVSFLRTLLLFVLFYFLGAGAQQRQASTFRAVARCLVGGPPIKPRAGPRSSRGQAPDQAGSGFCRAGKNRYRRWVAPNARRSPASFPRKRESRPLALLLDSRLRGNDWNPLNTATKIVTSVGCHPRESPAAGKLASKKRLGDVQQ